MHAAQANLRERKALGEQEPVRAARDLRQGPTRALCAYSLDPGGVSPAEHLMQGVLSLFTPRGGRGVGAIVEAEKLARGKPHVVVQIVERRGGVRIVDHTTLSCLGWIKGDLGRCCCQC